MSSSPSSMAMSLKSDKEENKKHPRPFCLEFHPGDDCPYMLEAPSMTGVKRHYQCLQDDDYIYFRQDMPGFGKENVMVSIRKKETITSANDGVEYALMIVDGEKKNELGEKQSKDDQEVGKRRYYCSFDISSELCKIRGIIWATNKGVFRKLVPRVNENLTGEVSYPVRDAYHFNNETGILEQPFLKRGCVRREWYAKEEKGKGFSIRIDMPGLALDDVKVSLEGDNKTMVIEGLGKKESEYEGYGRRHVRCKLDITKFSKTVRNTSLENGVFVLNIPHE